MFVTVSLIILPILYICWDVNYFIRTYFTVISSRLYHRKCSLNEVTSIFGFGTFQDCDLSFRHVRLSRLVRELDFARYHYYDRTGIYSNSRKIGIKSLQGSTLTVTSEHVPLFKAYKISTKLVYWDDRSLFFEHKVMTLHDRRLRVVLVSRQYAIGGSIKELLLNLPGSNVKVKCPTSIKHWLDSMKISSKTLRPN